MAKIAEEAAEVAQEALKCQTFGLHDTYGDNGTNVERLKNEFNDLLGVVELLAEEGKVDVSADKERIAAKKQKVNFYWRIVNETRDI